MIVLDAYAVLALLKGEPAAAAVARLLTEQDSASLTNLGIAEVVDHLVRVLHADPDDAVLDLAQLGLATGFEVDSALMISVGMLRSAHHHRRTRPVSLADCTAAEVARRAGAPLATSDGPLLDLCHAEGIATMPLADSAGRTWTPPGGGVSGGIPAGEPTGPLS